MISIEERFRDLKRRDERALMPFFTAGYPDMSTSLRLMKTAARSGADIIEVGIPFSDPIADGPAVQYSSQESLRCGTTIRNSLGALGEAREDLDIPIVLMTYFNPVFSMGVADFAREASAVHVSGVIIPDLPPEEAGETEKILKSRGIDTIYLVAPTSPPERIALITKRTAGFVYAVSVTGVTGTRSELPPELGSFLSLIRQTTEKPVCVGFGISTREQAGMLAKLSDGIIVGSAIVDIIRDNAGDPVGSVSAYLKAMKEALNA